MTPEFRNDGSLFNLVSNAQTGLGIAGKDSLLGTQFNYQGELTEPELRALYTGSWLVRRVVDLPAREMTKAWISLKITDGDEQDVAAVNSKLTQLDTQGALKDAVRWARLFGGSVILISANGNKDIDKPLNLDTVRSLDYLTVLDRWQITPAIGETDYIDPEFYQLITWQSGNRILDRNGRKLEPSYDQRIHKSRILKFSGASLPPFDKNLRMGWDASIVQNLVDVLVRYTEAGSSLSHALKSFSTFIMSLKNLSALVAEGNASAATEHMREMALMLSVYNMMLVDGDIEQPSFESRNLGGVPESIETIKTELTAASGMPFYKLWGTVGTSGLSDSGGAEERSWADEVHQQQEDHLRKPLRKLIELVMKVELGRVPDNWSFTFNPIWQPTEREKADIDSTNAKTNKTLQESGVIRADEWRRALATGQPISNVIDLRESNNSRQEVRTPPNGAQISAIVEVIKAIASGELPRDSGVQVIAAALAVSTTEADKIVGTAGKPKQSPVRQLRAV